MNCVATVRHIARESVETTPRTCCARVRRVIPFVYQPETTAYLETVGIVNDGTIYFSSTIYEITGSAIWTAVDNCVIAIKTALGLALGSVTLPNRMKFWYPRIGGTATRHKYNAVDPTTFVGTYAGTFTHDGAGDDPNGVNAYFDTDCTLNQFNETDITFMMFIKEDSNGTYADCGCVAGGVGELLFYPRRNTNQLQTRLTCQSESTDTNTSSLGFFAMTRNDANNFRTYKDGSVLETNANTSSPPNSLKIKEYTTSLGNDSTHVFYSPRRHTHFMGLDGVTDTEAQDIYNAIANLELALNR